ncbi:MAG: polyphosphate kinase 1 [Phycisphaerales bacterium]|nr:polyphosphate kinase 1 [Phycisphaerales bacterium]
MKSPLRAAGMSNVHDNNPTRMEPAATENSDLDEELSLSQTQTYFNRELSWLKFNARVLHEAVDDRTPLLERLRFLGIFTSNLDEFFMKRVGGLKRQVQAQVGALSVDGLTPAQQLVEIRGACVPMLELQAKTFTEVIKPALASNNIHLLGWDDLTSDEQDFAQGYYRQNVFPVLTPMAVDPGHPFPFLSNLSLSLAVKLYHPRLDDQLFARVKVPDMLPHWIRLPASDSGGFRFVSIMDVIGHNLATLFPGMDLMSVTPFRVTRNADVERDEEDAEDLLELIAQELRDRRFEKIVRLEHNPNADPWTIQFLMRELELHAEDVYELPAELDYTVMSPIWDLELPGLKYAPWTPITPPRLSDDQADIFSVIRTSDLLVHHPFENFTDSVERFIRAAAKDPKVLAIKLTLYRIGDSRSLMDSLIHAAEQGKQVVCLVELKARFDEQRNIFWAQQLERAGVHVVYGIVGLKTHTKLSLVVRQDSDEIRCYVHVGTGNYNVQTARLYTDLGLLTCRKEITNEVVELFHYLTGRSLKGDYNTLMVAPINMRERFVELIDAEIEHQKAGRPAGIIAKMNSLEDRKIIRRLYAASRAGVPIKLIVRGFCCLHPGLEGVSDNIEVTSVIGRYLEHSRIFFFRDGAEEVTGGKYFIGSADWMYRNLNRRVELVVPVDDPTGRARLSQVLDVLLNDRRQAWDMTPDGAYQQRQPTTPDESLGAHEVLMQMARNAAAVDVQRAQIGDAPQS